MGKQSREFRYHPVSFEDEDDEDQIARELGPPASSRRCCAKLLRGVVIMTIILSLAGAVATIALYSSSLFPRFGVNTTISVTEKPLSGSSDDEVVTKIPEGGGGEDDGKKASEEGVKDTATNTTISTTPKTTTAAAVNDGKQVEDDGKNAAGTDQKDADGSSQKVEVTTPAASSTGTYSPDEYDYSESGNDVAGTTGDAGEISEAELQELKTEGSKDDTKKKKEDSTSGGEDQLISDGQATSNESSSSSSSSNMTARAIGGNSTLENPDSSTNATAGHDGYLTYISQEDLIAAAALLSASFFMLTCTICCIIRLVRKRRRQKQEHFTRLVNDLRASEKFTIVSASDDDEASE